MSRLILRPIQVDDANALRAAVADFQKSDPGHEFVFLFEAEGDFSAYVSSLADRARGRNLPDGFVPETFLIATVDGSIVGRVSIRHELNPFLARIGGHIGYMVLAAHRRRGYATEILRQSLRIAASVGIKRALLTCDDGNVGSQRTIEKNAGVLEKIVPPGPENPELQVPKRRYWIDCA